MASRRLGALPARLGVAEESVSLPEKLSLSFTTAFRSVGFRLFSSTSAFTTSSSPVRSSKPVGSGTAASRKAFRLPDFVPSQESVGSQPFRGCRGGPRACVRGAWS